MASQVPETLYNLPRLNFFVRLARACGYAFAGAGYVRGRVVIVLPPPSAADRQSFGGLGFIALDLPKSARGSRALSSLVGAALWLETSSAAAGDHRTDRRRRHSETFRRQLWISLVVPSAVDCLVDGGVVDSATPDDQRKRIAVSDRGWKRRCPIGHSMTAEVGLEGRGMHPVTS